MAGMAMYGKVRYGKSLRGMAGLVRQVVVWRVGNWHGLARQAWRALAAWVKAG